MQTPKLVYLAGSYLILIGFIGVAFYSMTFNYNNFNYGLRGIAENVVIAGSILGALLLFIGGIYFFKKKKLALKWIIVSCSLSIFISFLKALLAINDNSFNVGLQVGFGYLIISLVIWGVHIWAFKDYIEKKQVGGQPVFA
jgi:hypothetical protein